MPVLTLTSGMKLLRGKQYETVYAQSLEALRNNEKDPLAFFLLGVLASDTGSHAKALELFAKAVEHGPKNVHYQTYYAKTLLAHGHGAQAKTHADLAAQIGTKDALLSDMIGVVYSRLGYHELAIPFFEKAVKRNPRWANFHFNLGASAEFIGDFIKAKTAYENVLALNPKFYLAWYSMTALKKQTPSNNKLEKLTALFQGAAGDAEGQLLLGHSIAKTLEDLERFKESFDWLEKAKRAKRSQIKYSQQDMAKVFDAAKTTSQTDNAKPYTATGMGPTPIFIIGLPRTGTTLVDRIISSHDKVRSAGELTLFPDLIKLATGRPINTGVDFDDFRASNQIDLSSVGQHYLERTKPLVGSATHLIDKMPFNFFYAGLINRALPQAKIITLRRGAMDSCLSNYRQVFASHKRDHDYAYDIDDMAAYYRELDGLMTHWRKTLPTENFMEINYEDIVSDQENQTRQLLGFCGLNWDDACLNFHENRASTDTASAVQVRQPLHSGSIERWKKYGDKLGGLKAALGELAD